MSHKLLTTGQAAKHLKISKWTLRRWVLAKRIKPRMTRKNGYLAFDKKDLDRVLSEGKNKKYVKVSKRPQVAKKPKKSKPSRHVKKDVKLLPERITRHPRIKSERSVSVSVQRDVTLTKEQVIIVPARNASHSDAGGPAPQNGGQGGSAPKKEDEKTTHADSSKKASGGFLNWLFGNGNKLPILILFLLSFASFRTFDNMHKESREEMAVDEGTVLSYKTEKPVMQRFSLLDSVMAAATDSSDTKPGLQFLMTSEESIEQLMEQDETPPTGSKAYTGKVTSYQAYNDSPYSFLAGEHGEAGPVAIIEKADTLVTQPFFANVHDGDKLLIYKAANRALLFRPLSNTVVAFGALDVISNQNPFVSGLTGEETTTILIRNGLSGDRDVVSVINEVKSKLSDVQIVDSDLAMRDDYKKTILIDESRGAKSDLASQYARKLGIPVADLPSEEPHAPSGVDFIILVGSNWISRLSFTPSYATQSAVVK